MKFSEGKSSKMKVSYEIYEDYRSGMCLNVRKSDSNSYDFELNVDTNYEEDKDEDGNDIKFYNSEFWLIVSIFGKCNVYKLNFNNYNGIDDIFKQFYSDINGNCGLNITGYTSSYHPIIGGILPPLPKSNLLDNINIDLNQKYLQIFCIETYGPEEITDSKLIKS